MATCQFEKAEQHLAKQVSAYHRHRHFLEAAPGNYLGALSDLLVSRYRTGQYTIVMQMIQRLKKLPDTSEIKRITSKRFRMVIFSWTFKLEVGIAIHTNTLPAQLKAIQEHEQFFNRPGMVMEPRNRLETLLALATMYFQLKDHKKAARLTERLLRDEAAGMHQELNVLARVLQVLLHYEDGSFDVLDYLVSGLKRFVARQKETGRMAKQLVEFTGKLKNLHRKRNSKLFFEDQFKKFSVLKNDRFEKQHFDYFDVTTWLAKKVNR